MTRAWDQVIQLPAWDIPVDSLNINAANLYHESAIQCFQFLHDCCALADKVMSLLGESAWLVHMSKLPLELE